MREIRITRTGSGVAEKRQADEPRYVISVAARLVGVHAQTLRYYERLGFVHPARTRGNIRLFTQQDVDRARWVKSLMEDLGINLAGVEVLMRMSSHMSDLERRVEELAKQLEEARGAGPRS